MNYITNTINAHSFGSIPSTRIRSYRRRARISRRNWSGTWSAEVERDLISAGGRGPNAAKHDLDTYLYQDDTPGISYMYTQYPYTILQLIPTRDLKYCLVRGGFIYLDLFVPARELKPSTRDSWSYRITDIGSNENVLYSSSSMRWTNHQTMIDKLEEGAIQRESRVAEKRIDTQKASH